MDASNNDFISLIERQTKSDFIYQRKNWVFRNNLIYPTPPFRQDMKQRQFFNAV